jgi:mRNA interferase MazF
MAEFVKGHVVIIPFPFFDLSGSKRRPAFVVASIPDPDIILCQITSIAKSDPYAVRIEKSDLIQGKAVPSYSVKPGPAGFD